MDFDGGLPGSSSQGGGEACKDDEEEKEQEGDGGEDEHSDSSSKQEGLKETISNRSRNGSFYYISPPTPSLLNVT